MKIQLTVELNPEDVDEFFIKLAQTLSAQMPLNTTSEKEYYSISEVAKKLNIKNPSTLYNHIEVGILKADKIGKSWRISHQNLQNYVNKKHQ